MYHSDKDVGYADIIQIFLDAYIAFRLFQNKKKLKKNWIFFLM